MSCVALNMTLHIFYVNKSGGFYATATAFYGERF